MDSESSDTTSKHYFHHVQGSVTFAIWLGYTPLFLAVLIGFIIRRKLYPIKQSQPWLIVTSAIGGYAMMTSYTWENFAGPDNYPCILSHWLIWVAFPCYFMPYPLRAFRLIFIFKLNWAKHDIGIIAKSEPSTPAEMTDGEKTIQITMDIEEGSVRSSPPPGSVPLVVRYRYLLLRCGYVMYLVLFGTIVIALFRQFLVKDNLPPNTGCQNSPTFFITSIIVFSVFVIALIIAIGFLRNVKDEFNISNELKIVCASWVLLLVPFLIINFVTTLQDRDPYPWTVYLLGSWTAVSHFVSLFWPLYRSFFAVAEVEWPDCDVVSSLESVVSHEISLKYFKEFLVSEFSVENLTFYMDVSEFRSLKEYDNLTNRAFDIYDKYLADNAVFEINLDSLLTNNVKTAMRQLRINLEKSSSSESASSKKELVRSASQAVEQVRTMYDEAAKACFELMRFSSFPRFRRSPLCRELVKKLKIEEARKDTMSSLKLL